MPNDDTLGLPHVAVRTAKRIFLSSTGATDQRLAAAIHAYQFVLDSATTGPGGITEYPTDGIVDDYIQFLYDDYETTAVLRKQ